MAQNPDIRVRLVSEGDKQVIAAMRAVRVESELAGRSAKTGFSALGASAASALNPINALKAALPALGLTALVAGLIAASKSVLNFSDLSGKAAERINTTAEAFSTLAAAAELAEVDTAGLEAGLGILAKNVSGLKNGTSSASDSLAELGLSASDFIGLDTAAAFEKISQRMFKFAAAGDRGRLAMDIMGKSGRQLLPLMRDVSERGLAAMTAEAEALGIMVSGKASADADKFGDNLTQLGQAAKGAARRFIDDLLPGINDVTAAMVEAAKEGGILKALLVGFGGVVSLIINGSEVSQAKKAVDEAAALVEESKKLVASGRVPIPGLGFLGIDLKANEKATEGLKRVLGEREKILIAARARLAELTKPPEKKEGGDGDDLEAFDAAKRVAELTKSLKLDEIKSSEAASDRQRAITEAQIKNEEALLAARQTGAAGQAAIDRAAFQSIAARTALEKQAFNDDMASIDLRQRAITSAVQKEIAELTKTGKSTKQQQAVLVELNKQSLDQRLAVTQTHYQKLLALNFEYIARYKAAGEAIKSIDRENSDNRINREKGFNDIRNAGLSQDQKFAADRRTAEEKVSQLRAAALSGDLEKARELNKEIQAITLSAAQSVGGSRVMEGIAEDSENLLKLALNSARAAEVAKQALADKGITDTAAQLKVAGEQIKEFFTRRLGTIDLKFGADQQALTSLVDSLREQLGKEVFKINITPNLTGGTGAAPGFARGGLIPGPASLSGPDNVLAFLKSGEHVTRVAAVQYYGKDFLRAINEMKLPKFAEGGFVGGGASAPTGQVHHVDLSFNKRPIGRLSGPRDVVRGLLDALDEVSRGT